jgi:hypothetical protein
MLRRGMMKPSTSERSRIDIPGLTVTQYRRLHPRWRKQNHDAVCPGAIRCRTSGMGPHAWDTSQGRTTDEVPSREERMAARRYQAARVQLYCPATDTLTQELILEQATIYADGWAQWDEMAM